MLSYRQMANAQHESDSCCAPLWRLLKGAMGQYWENSEPIKGYGHVLARNAQACKCVYKRAVDIITWMSQGNVECPKLTFPERTGGAMGQ